MKKAFNSYYITKTIILSLFVLFFGIIYIVFVKTDEYNPSELLETYIVETNNNYYKLNEYSGYGTYETDLSLVNRSTNSNIVSIEMYVFSEYESELVTEKETSIKNESIDTETTTLDTAQAKETKKNIKSSKTSDNKDCVNINIATAEELDTLPKIGPSIANAIIKYREKYGEFKSIEQIKNVTGIGDKIFESIKDLISV